DVTGTVREIGLFRTELVTDDGTFISIPNTSIFQAIIINVSRENTRRTNFTVEIDRAENLDHVQKAILDGLMQDSRVLKTPAPWLEVDALGPVSTTIAVHAWLRNSDFLAAQSELKKRVRHALQDAEVSAPVPVGPPAVAPWQPPEEN